MFTEKFVAILFAKLVCLHFSRGLGEHRKSLLPSRQIKFPFILMYYCIILFFVILHFLGFLLDVHILRKGSKRTCFVLVLALKYLN